MLQPISLRVENFKTFPYFEFEFPKEQGLYFVAGRNDAHPELEGNACGKSTLFCDASGIVTGKQIGRAHV